MDKQDVMDYVLNTPTNTNPRILKEMLSSIQGEGGSGSSGKVRIVDSLPENGEDGDLVLITKQYFDEPQNVILITENAINEVFDIEDYYNYYKNSHDIQDNLTEEQKMEARGNNNTIENFIDKNIDIDMRENLIYAVFPSLTNSVTFINPGPHERVDVDEEDFYEKTIDGTTIKVYDAEQEWAGIENINRDKGLFCRYFPVIPSNATYFYDDDKEDYYVPYKDGYICTDSLLISSSANTVFWVPALSNQVEGDPETDLLPSDKEGYIKICMDYIYLPSGTYELYSDFINLSNQEVENAGWYTLLVEASNDVDWDHADMEEMFIGMVPTTQSDFYTIETDLSNNCYFQLDYLINENNKVVLNLPERPYLNFYEWNATGLFIRKNKKWETIPIGELKKSFFDNLLNEEIIENKRGLFLLAYTPYLNDNNELVLSGYDFGKHSDGVEYWYTDKQVDLSSLKDTDKYINNIQRYPDGDDSDNYCYRAYQHYTDGRIGYDNYDYFTFYIPKQDSSNYVTKSTFNDTLSDYVTNSSLSNTLNNELGRCFTQFNEHTYMVGFFTSNTYGEYSQVLGDEMYSLKWQEAAPLAASRDSSIYYDNSNVAKYMVLIPSTLSTEHNNNYYSYQNFDSCLAYCIWVQIDFSDEISALEARIAALEGNNNS